MAVEQISKRFTLHDILAYLFSGMVALIFVTALLVANSFHRHVEVTRAQWLFHDLHLSTQVIVYSTTAYLLGLMCTWIGDKLYKVCGYSKLEPLFEDDGNEWALSTQIKVLFKEKVCKLLNCASQVGGQEIPTIPNKEQVSIAYSCLMLKGKDSFVQLMSGRGAMYSGLAGTFLATFAVGFLIQVITCVLEWPSSVINFFAIFGAPFGIWWALSNAHKYDNWWKRHVVFGFLADALSLEGKGKEREESQAT